MNDLLKDKIQKESVQAWLKSDKKGTLELITGLGKTFCSLHVLYTMPQNDGKLHLFLAEQVDRQADLIKDIVKYNEIFDKNVLKDYNLQFQCYQTTQRWKDKEFGLIIADEIHDSLTPSYSQFYFNNKYDAIIGLSATINKKVEYIDKDGKMFTKGDLLNKIAPVCFKYTVNQGQLEGTSRKLNIYVINHKLDEINKTVKSGSIKKSFYQTEKVAYDYWDKQFKRSLFLQEEESIKDLKIRVASNKRKKILYTLESKIIAIKELLNNINGKSIIFGNDLDSLLKITPNVVSSRNNISTNNLIRNSFDLDRIKVIASFKKLEQGANLSSLDNVILHSYYGVEGKIIQRIGRNRINGDKVGSVFVLVTKDTQEEKWWNSATENMTEFNIINCDNIEDCIKKYKKNE
jgi:superfamily II DNA or RNA helicase